MADGDSDDAGRLMVAGWVLDHGLGSGEFSEVWQARNPDTDLVRALKVVRPVDPGRNEDNEDGLKAWRREVQRLEGLSHPHILRFYDAGKVREGIYRGHAWLTTELCEQSLADVLQRRVPRTRTTRHNNRLWKLPTDTDKLSSQQADELLDQMLAALAAAHGNGIVHRDVKPANVLQRRDGSWKLGDFGIAHLIDPALSTTDTQTAGTTPYLSRAALDGTQDHAADLYALGVTLHEALTGHYLHPWPGDMTPARFVAQVLTTEPTISPALPDRWRAIISRLITAADSSTFAAEFHEYLDLAEKGTVKEIPRPQARGATRMPDGGVNGSGPTRIRTGNRAGQPSRDHRTGATRARTDGRADDTSTPDQPAWSTRQGTAGAGRTSVGRQVTDVAHAVMDAASRAGRIADEKWNGWKQSRADSHAPTPDGDGRRDEAGDGGPLKVSVPYPGLVLGARVKVNTPEGSTVEVPIPPGTEPGTVIHVSGDGPSPEHPVIVRLLRRPGPGSGELRATKKLAGAIARSSGRAGAQHNFTHPVLRSEDQGGNRKLTVAVPYPDLVLGTRLKIPSPNGTVTVRVPPGHELDEELRVPAMGQVSGSGRSDLVVALKLTVPDRLSSSEHRWTTALADAMSVKVASRTEQVIR